jgi:hypothetical protein
MKIKDIRTSNNFGKKTKNKELKKPRKDKK